MLPKATLLIATTAVGVAKAQTEYLYIPTQIDGLYCDPLSK